MENQQPGHPGLSGPSYEEWVAAVLDAARGGDLAQVADFLTERLDGTPLRPVPVSPPLLLGEGSRSSILLSVCNRLLDGGDGRALRVFREALVLVAARALDAGDYKGVFDRASWLIAACGVGDDPDLAGRTRDMIWGRLFRLAGSVQALPGLRESPDGRWAQEMFDTWLSVQLPATGAADSASHPTAEALMAALRRAVRAAMDVPNDRYAGAWPFLLFHGLMKRDAAMAGRLGLPDLHRLWNALAGQGENAGIMRRDLGLMLEGYAHDFEWDDDPAWRDRFLSGVRASQEARNAFKAMTDETEIGPLMRQGLAQSDEGLVAFPLVSRKITLATARNRPSAVGAVSSDRMGAAYQDCGVS